MKPVPFQAPKPHLKYTHRYVDNRFRAFVYTGCVKPFGLLGPWGRRYGNWVGTHHHSGPTRIHRWVGKPGWKGF